MRLIKYFVAALSVIAFGVACTLMVHLIMINHVGSLFMIVPIFIAFLSILMSAHWLEDRKT